MTREREVTLAPDGRGLVVSLPEVEADRLVEPMLWIIQYWATHDYASALSVSEADARRIVHHLTAAMADARSADGGSGPGAAQHDERPQVHLVDGVFTMVLPDETVDLLLRGLRESFGFWQDPSHFGTAFGWTPQEAKEFHRDLYAQVLQARQPPPPPGPDGVEVPASDAPFRRTATYDRREDPEGFWIDPARLTITDSDSRRRIVDFLDRGSLVIVGMFRTADELDPTRGDVVPVGQATDGVWLWGYDLAYYVREHGLSPEPEFLRYMADHDWKTPAPTRERVLQAVAQTQAEAEASARLRAASKG